MEEGVSAKRRKLNAPQHRSSPANYKRNVSTGVNGISANEHTVSSPSVPTNSTKGNTAAHRAWAEAKANRNAHKGKRPVRTPNRDASIDVYDDIDGAHTHQSPLKKSNIPSTLPARKQLDPLRNQRTSATSTPRPAKAGTTTGFFKQFHQPRAAAAQDTPEKKLVDETGSDGRTQEDEGVDAGADLGSESSDAEAQEGAAPDTPLQSSGRGSWKGWAYDAKPKKTYEDQIKEVAEAAREDAKNETEGQPATAPMRRRRRLGSPSPIAPAAKAQSTSRAKPDAKPKCAPPSERRKNNHADHVEPAKTHSHELEDAMDMDDSHDDVSLATNGKHTVDATPTATPTKVNPQRSIPPEPSKKVTFSSESLRLIQTIILDKLTGRRPVELSISNMTDEHNKVKSLITQTITSGESNSMLVIGTRGSGKTALVNQILREQAVKRAGDYHVVRLNGFIHIDDKIALREIWRQLGREMELDEEESTSKNYADTLTTLLALLSHPAEHGHEQQPNQVTKSVIFILDEFELFANHPRQTLLYNLFDIAQSRKAPIAVLGLTTRIDVAESLEKRVKSRFSHRYVHLSLAKSFIQFKEACEAVVLVQSPEISKQELEQLGASSEAVAEPDRDLPKSTREAHTDWNTFVGTKLINKVFDGYLKRLYYRTKSVPEFHTALLMPVSTMPVEEPASIADVLEHFTNSIGVASLGPPDSKLSLLSSLSTLQLALLICAARLTAIHNVETVPFAQAYEEYKVLASKAKLQASAAGALAQGAGSRIWSKDLARDAWEELIDIGLVMSDGTRGCRVDVGLEEIGMSGVDLGSWSRWCREI